MPNAPSRRVRVTLAFEPSLNRSARPEKRYVKSRATNNDKKATVDLAVMKAMIVVKINHPSS